MTDVVMLRERSADMGDRKPLLSVEDLVTYFYAPDGIVKAVDGVSLSIYPGEVLAVVGESGSGKSVTALSVMRLLPEPPSKTLRGKVLFAGDDLLKKSQQGMQSIRGRRISMIFQNPYTALNPLFTIGDQLVETARRHARLTRRQAFDIVAGLMGQLGIKRPLETLRSYPFEVSMGASQRSMLASALLGKPELLIADEPTTMLDAIAQVEILDLMRKLKVELGMAVWLITHDFGVVSYMSDRVVVMYAGQPVETGMTSDVLNAPKHPYTLGLIKSVPMAGADVRRLTQIPGEIPDPKRLPVGCRFAPRCAAVMDMCRTTEPPMVEMGPESKVRCWLFAK